MARTPEGHVKAAVVKVLKTHGAYYFFPMTGGFGKGGVPDIIVCHRGCFIGIECKAGKGKPTALQLAEQAKIRAAEGISLIIYETGIEEVNTLLNTITTLFPMKDKDI